MLVPLYGFLRGDTIGLIVLVQDDQRVADIGASLQQAASVRVAPAARVSIVHNGRVLNPAHTVAAAGLAPLDRIDVIPEGGP